VNIRGCVDGSTVSSRGFRSSTDSTRSTIRPGIGLGGSEDVREERLVDFSGAEMSINWFEKEGIALLRKSPVKSTNYQLI
jgi:hypothetical protein